MKRVTCLAAFAMLLGAAPVAPAPAPDPYEIFALARQYWQRQHYPASIGYKVAVDVTEAGKERVEHYPSYYDALHDAIHVDSVSDYQKEHPPSGRGVALMFNFLGGKVRLGRPDFPVDFLGVPELAPNYSFGIAPYVPASKMTPDELVAEIRREFHDSKPTPTPGPSANGLTEIADVVAYKRYYRIVLVGVDAVEGLAAYHLGLTPLREPTKYRLRDVWIDTKTYATRKLVSDGNFVNGPGPGATWTVTFASVDGQQYIAQEQTAQPLEYGGLRYSDVSIRFEDVRAQEPPYFDGLYEPQNPDDLLNEPPR
jgi:hypothetical protein